MKHYIMMLCLLVLAGSATVTAEAQISKAKRDYLEYLFTTPSADRCYKLGEEATVEVLAYTGGIGLSDVEVTYDAGDDMLPADKKGTVRFKDGKAIVPIGTMQTPGFRYCNVSFTYDGQRYKDFIKVGFEPQRIEPLTTMPEDFARYWAKAMKKAAKVPMQAEVTPCPEFSTDKVDVSVVKLQCARKGRYVYGYLSKPKAAGKHPVILVPPGAGVKKIAPTTLYAEEGFITLDIEIHGIDFATDEESFKAIKEALGDYWYIGIEDKDTYYYKDVYLACVRCIDFLQSLPEFDGKNTGVSGGSQGGALSIVTAGLDKRVNFLVAYYPALSDVTGFVGGRAGGWPSMFVPGREPGTDVDPTVAMETMRYYDVVNFARSITVPGFYSHGYADNTCCPTSVSAVFNSITAPKTVVVTPTSAHWRFPQTNLQSIQWMKSQLK